ncbi:MAG TPA: phage holin family protein [Verrucomicrobiae bacterium]|nr:phage holin family protein [Verrucomicrobiae bacterium]
MNDSQASLTEIPAASRRLAKRAMDLGVNRMELLLVELEEERERIVQAIIYALVASVFGLLCGITFTLCVVLLFLDSSPLIAAAVLTVVYAIVAVLIGTRLATMRRDWHAFGATLDQLRKDSACLAHLIP